jgi:hypothetical protein
MHVWTKYFNEKNITCFLYFKEADQCFDEKTDDAFRTEQQKLFGPFLAKRIINDYKGLLNKHKIPEDYNIVHPWILAYASFLYFCKIFDKKEYIECLETYIKVEVAKRNYGTDIDT